ncbi:MAG: GspE/PulE family protein, partial [Burkholderiaceae bacterium]
MSAVLIPVMNNVPVTEEQVISPIAIDTAIVQRARISASKSQRSVMAELELLTALDPRQVVQAVALRFKLQVAETIDMLAFTPAFDLLPLSKALQKHCVLLRGADQHVVGIIADPFDPDLQTWLGATAKSTIKSPLQIRLALQSDIQAYLSKQEESARAVDSIEQSAGEGRRDGKTAAILSFASVSEAASPAVKLVNSTLYDALKAGASDIHLESTANGLAVKYRVDGVLDHATTVNGIEVAEQIISRLKVLAELDIAERRVPQDGSFRVETGGREIDLRVSIMPSIHGEDSVIRVLDKRAMIEAYGSLTL